MKFSKSEPNENLDAFRTVSENGLWELGCRRMLFGIRVSLSRTCDCWYTLDYCSGDDPAFTLQLLAIVAAILERYPETVHPSILERDFPRYDIKPIDRDPYCWKRLQEMARLATNNSPES